MTLTYAERMYDFNATSGRAEIENNAFSAGITIGILSDYLVSKHLFDYYSPGETMYGSTKDLYLQGVEEGRDCQRFDYTAEELYTWAHELDVETLGLKNMWPFPYIDRKKQ